MPRPNWTWRQWKRFNAFERANRPLQSVANKRKQVQKIAELEADRGAAISAAMKELNDVRTKARAKRNGTPAKPLIFSEWLKALLAGKPFHAEAIAKKYPEIKESSIRSWSYYWLRNGGVGPGYPERRMAK